MYPPLPHSIAVGADSFYVPAASREPFSCARLCSASCRPPGRSSMPRHFAEECGDSFRPSAGVSCRANRVSSIWRRAACFRIYFLLTLTLPKILRQPIRKLPTKFDRHIRLARSRHGVSACEKVFFICRIIHIIKFVLYIRGDTFSILPPPEAGHAQPVGAGAPQANGMMA